LGDSYFAKHHGCTALGWMTLQGKKEDGTDMHSRTAISAGCSRDNAKVLNYARIYGAGLSFSKQLLQEINPNLSSVQASANAKTMMRQTKGQQRSKK